VAPGKAVAARSGMLPLIALIIGVIIIIVVYVLSSTASTDINDLQSKINQQQKLITDAQASITQQKKEGAGQLDQYRQQLSGLKEPLDALAQQRAYSNRDLGTVTAMLPAIMYLTSIKDDGSTLVLEGSAPSSEIVLDYARDLRQSSNFNNVRLTSLENQTYSNFKFTIALDLKR
jgi:Tfp pilus assembly protein PilN